MEKVCFKDTETCAACLAAVKRELMKEIREEAGCNKCNRLFLLAREDHPIVHRVHGKLKQPRARKVL